MGVSPAKNHLHISMLLASLLLPVACSFLLSYSFPAWRWENEPLHAGCTIALSLATLFMAAIFLRLDKPSTDTLQDLWVACAFIAFGILNFFHLIVRQADLFVWLHSIALLSGGLCIVLVWLPPQTAGRKLRQVMPWVALLTAFTCGLLAIAVPQSIPAMVSQGAFTNTAKAINLLGGGLFLAAAVWLAARYFRNKRSRDLLLANLSILLGVAALSFSLSSPWCLTWWFWHLLEFTTSLLILALLFIDYGKALEAVRQAQHSLEQRVEERTKQLAQLTHDLNIILENAPIGISKMVDGKQVWINRRIENIFQYAKSELEFHSARKLYPSDETYLRLGKELYPILAQGEVFETVQGLIRKDGVNIPVRCIGKAVEPPEISKGVIWLLEDITESTQADAKLRLNSEIMKNIAEGIYLIRLEDNTIVYANQRFEKMFGYDPGEMIGKDIAIVNVPAAKSPTEAKQAIIDELAKNGEWHGEVENIKKDGTRFWCYANVSLFDHPEYGRVIVSVHTDITEYKRLEAEKRGVEERLHRAEKMEAIGTLAGGVAHDLNNVLGALLGNAELLLMDLKKTDPLFDLAEHIISSGRQAAAEVQDLLTMARRGVIIKEPASLNLIVVKLLKTSELVQLRSSYPQVNIATEYDSDLLDISASIIHVERALTNLISNGLRAMGGKGTLTIRTGNRYLDRPEQGYEQVPPGEYAVLSVSDTGDGIPPEHLPHLFEPFYMRKVSKQGGTGLGLSVIWGALKDHNAYIDVDSVPGAGTTFTLYFPVTRGNGNSVPPEERNENQYRGTGETILVVDHEESL